MREELNLLRPYSYTEVQKSGFINYRFTTDRSIDYLVYFTEGTSYFPAYPDFNKDIVTFGFGPNHPTSKGIFLKYEERRFVPVRYDPRVKDTLFQIILDTLEVYPQRSIFIMCDMMDGKHFFRNTLFNTWFIEFDRAFPGRISKYNNEICSPGGDCAKLIMLIPHSCTWRAQIKEAFLSLDDDLKAKGY